MELHQTKKILHTKENHQKMKRQHTEWENILASDTPEKVLIFKLCKELKQLTTKNKQTKNNPIKTGAKDLLQRAHTNVQ